MVVALTVGAVSGLIAAVVWHVAVPPGIPAPLDAETGLLRTSWWPSLLVLPLVGLVCGVVVGMVAVRAQWRLRRDAGGSLSPLTVFLVASALVPGVVFAVAWSVWPPSDTYVDLAEFRRSGDPAPSLDPFAEDCRMAGMQCFVITDEPERWPGLLREPPTRVPVGNPWLTFPLLSLVGAASAGLVVARAGGRLVGPGSSHVN